MSPVLLFCAPAPVARTPRGFRLDIKFVEGMRAHVTGWGGPIRCILWEGAGDIPFGRDYAPTDLGFELIVLPPGAPVSASTIDGAGAAMVSADMPGFAAMVAAIAARGLPVVAALEYTLETRLRILWLNRRTGGWARLGWRALRTWVQDRRMRRAFGALAGVQFNGYPAFDAYAGQVRRPYLYLDNRMRPGMMATEAEMQARALRLRQGAPLRLIHSGRLEPMKGAQDLLPVMAGLRTLGVRATLDIYGSGSLEGELRDGLAQFGGDVRLHGPVDFETELVPVSRTAADVFLSCHRQSDPSCTYLEAMGCGLAMAGYANRMWSRLAGEAAQPAPAQLGQPRALADRIAAWDRDREALIAAADSGWRFARQHDFDREFAGRMAHLRDCSLA